MIVKMWALRKDSEKFFSKSEIDGIKGRLGLEIGREGRNVIISFIGGEVIEMDSSNLIRYFDKYKSVVEDGIIMEVYEYYGDLVLKNKNGKLVTV